MVSNHNGLNKNIYWYVFPLLVAVYPIFYLYAANIDKLDLSVLGKTPSDCDGGWNPVYPAAAPVDSGCC